MANKSKEQDSLVSRLIDELEVGVGRSSFDPISTWFSYGSNLHVADFAQKMEDVGGYHSKLTIQNPRVAALPGYQRKLGNKSTRRCLAYTVERREDSDSHVFGIVHEVPLGELLAFLTMEGVVKEGRLRPDAGEDQKRYGIIRIPVLCNGFHFEAFVLKGRIPSSIESMPRDDAICKNKLMSYVKIARSGANQFRIDPKPFDEDFTEISAHFERARV